MPYIFRLLHPRSGDIQGLETFLAPSSDNRTRNYDSKFKESGIGD